MLVEVAVAFLDDGFEIAVNGVNGAGGVHPAAAFIEALVDEELSPRRRAVSVQAFAADHLQLGPEEKRRVRIDEQQRAPRRRVRWRNGDAVRPARFRLGEHRLLFFLIRPACDLAGAVKSLQLIEVDGFDVAADAAFGERKRHPGFEAFDHSRFYLRMFRQIKIQPIGPGVHERLEPRRAGLVMLLQRSGVNEQFHSQIPPHGCFAFGLRQPPHRVEVVRLDPVEIVFGLGVDRAEDRIGVGLAVNVRDAPVIADDRDVASLLRPPLRFSRLPAR
ncbi:MAG: hypothetical protein JMDDDDMK_03815 [Acidobacteria bacterium]|nr:hypothetical protein [Acidobacteriota bacterium]